MKSIKEILDCDEILAEELLVANKNDILDLTIGEYYAGVMPKKKIENGFNSGFGPISKAEAEKLCIKNNTVFTEEEVIYIEKHIVTKQYGKRLEHDFYHVIIPKGYLHEKPEFKSYLHLIK